jgi:hypothetical protein
MSQSRLCSGGAEAVGRKSRRAADVPSMYRQNAPDLSCRGMAQPRLLQNPREFDPIIERGGFGSHTLRRYQPGNRDTTNGSNPARRRVVCMMHRQRAEIFALPLRSSGARPPFVTFALFCSMFFKTRGQA